MHHGKTARAHSVAAARICSTASDTGTADDPRVQSTVRAPCGDRRHHQSGGTAVRSASCTVSWSGQGAHPALCRGHSPQCCPPSGLARRQTTWPNAPDASHPAPLPGRLTTLPNFANRIFHAVNGEAAAARSGSRPAGDDRYASYLAPPSGTESLLRLLTTRE